MLSAGRTPRGSPSRLERQGTGRDKVKDASVSVVWNNKRRELEVRRTMGRKFPGRSVAAHPWTPTHEAPSGWVVETYGLETELGGHQHNDHS